MLGENDKMVPYARAKFEILHPMLGQNEQKNPHHMLGLLAPKTTLFSGTPLVRPI